MSDDEKWMSLAIKQAIKAEEEGEVPVDLALRYSASYNNNIFSFVNNI